MFAVRALGSDHLPIAAEMVAAGAAGGGRGAAGREELALKAKGQQGRVADPAVDGGQRRHLGVFVTTAVVAVLVARGVQLRARC